MRTLLSWLSNLFLILTNLNKFLLSFSSSEYNIFISLKNPDYEHLIRDLMRSPILKETRLIFIYSNSTSISRPAILRYWIKVLICSTMIFIITALIFEAVYRISLNLLTNLQVSSSVFWDKKSPIKMVLLVARLFRHLRTFYWWDCNF